MKEIRKLGNIGNVSKIGGDRVVSPPEMKLWCYCSKITEKQIYKYPINRQQISYLILFDFLTLSQKLCLQLSE